jgi:4-alpha-glucanotransferase
MFLCQWQELKSYANDKGISIMGDIPIYVGIDSLDVWGCRENFLLDAQGKPAFVAGVPPDYFSATGQRWGNPIYDWEYMKQSGFTFWINRLAYSSQLYDVIRIDHFRAFDTYWKIPASCETAIEGEWVEAPGYQLFDTIFKELPDIQIVVEDLGDLRPEVLKLRDYYRFMGMNVVEFTLLHQKPIEHQLIYTGTHDNQTVLGWYQSMDAKERRKVYVKLLGSGMPWESISYKMIRYMLKSPARLAIMPLMDVLELDDSARLNTPGTVGSPNWEWRLDSLEKVRACRKRMRKLLMQTGRI